jgi:SAM-dependent methyltransferase
MDKPRTITRNASVTTPPSTPPSTPPLTEEQRSRVEGGERYRFGENWSRFLEVLDEERIGEAERSLRSLLRIEDLEGSSFLDIGSGSGLFSLAAHRLGARVHSFDFDLDSVECAQRLRERFAPDSGRWRVERGSVLDEGFLARLGTFDVVYSWGVLHHTGAMHEAIRRAAERVSPDGRLAIALYRRTRLCGFWKIEKRLYSASPPALQSVARSLWKLRVRLAFLLKGKDFSEMVRTYVRRRGMNFDRDVDDWLGGYPYESIDPDECRRFVEELGFELWNEKVATRKIGLGLSGSGCDEFVFRKLP